VPSRRPENFRCDVATLGIGPSRIPLLGESGQSAEAFVKLLLSDPRCAAPSALTSMRSASGYADTAARIRRGGLRCQCYRLL